MFGRYDLNNLPDYSQIAADYEMSVADAGCEAWKLTSMFYVYGKSNPPKACRRWHRPRTRNKAVLGRNARDLRKRTRILISFGKEDLGYSPGLLVCECKRPICKVPSVAVATARLVLLNRLQGCGIARGCSPLRDCPLHRSLVLMGSRQLVLGTKSDYLRSKDGRFPFCSDVSSTL